MDNVIIMVYRRMVIRSQCSAEDVLEDPKLRLQFLTEVRLELKRDVPERQLLHRLTYLRKQRKLPRFRDVATA